MFASSAKLKGTMLDPALGRRSPLVRRNKGSSLKLKLGPFPRRIKIFLLELRFQLRRKEGANVATYVVRRATLLLLALMVPYPTPL